MITPIIIQYLGGKRFMMMATVRKYEKGKMTLKQQLSLKLKGERRGNY